MWIYYYACFGPGHQSEDYGFKSFPDDYDRESIKDSLFNMLFDKYNVSLRFWEVERPSANYVEKEMRDTKDRIKNLRKYLKTLEAKSCFVPEEKEEEDLVLMKNLSDKIVHDLLKRLHNAGYMYCASDISNWKYGKKCLTEPKRSKILRIIRKSKSYPSY